MDKQINGYFYVRVENILYGLVQAGIITYTAIQELLNPFGY